jgi:hypothetical protein
MITACTFAKGATTIFLSDDGGRSIGVMTILNMQDGRRGGFSAGEGTARAQVTPARILCSISRRLRGCRSIAISRDGGES